MSNVLLQEAILTQFKFDINSLQSKENPSENYLRSMLRDLEDTFTHSKRMHADLVTNELPTPEITQYNQSNTFREIREHYHTLWAKLEDLIPKKESPSLEETLNQTINLGNFNQQDCGTSGLKLPRLTLPQFSGEIDDWKNFYNLFACSIHADRKLKPVQKLQYLQTNVSGQAKEIVKNYTLEDRNYELALQALKDEYDHERVLANRQISILFNLPAITTESSSGIKNVLNKTRQALVTLENLGLEVSKWDCILIYLIQNKLPRKTNQTWEDTLGRRRDIPTYQEFRDFLESRYRSLEMMELSVATSSEQKKSSKTFHASSNKPKVNSLKCTLCKQSHYLSRCYKFMKLSDKDKFDFVCKHKLCKNCLSEFHTESNCSSQRTCSTCSMKHHTMIHKNFSTEIKQTENSNTPLNNNRSRDSASGSSPGEVRTRNYHITANNNKVTLLGTAQLKMFNNRGHYKTVRALVDPCSDESYITESTLHLLGLGKYYSPTSVSVIGEHSVDTCSHRSDFLIGSLYNNFKSFISAIVVKTITSELPHKSVPSEDLTFLDGLYLADPSFDHPGEIHMLLGADIASDIEVDGFKRFKRTSARDSKLGWIVRGVVESEVPVTRPKVSFFTTSNSDQFNFELEKFWKLEEVRTVIRPHPDDEFCESLFQSSVERLEDGRFCVSLPFRNGVDPVLGSSKEIALRRFLNLEKKLERDPELKAEYHKTIKEYLSSGHMILRSSDVDFQGKEYTIPHHAVFKLSSSTTKVRVVFDASCKTSDGTSLNEHLLIGPKLQVDIRDILFLWRRYEFVITADIARMYRQFWISKTHHSYQQILWRFSVDEPIQEYFLTTVTFGTSPAPYLAIRLLLHLSNSEAASSLPLAAEACRKEFYVDDLLSGAFDEQIVIEKQKQIRELLSGAGLQIRKWCSNIPQALVGIPEEDIEMSDTTICFEETDFRKTLGILWSPESDCFSFSCSDGLETEIFTKRRVLSLISKLFDPLGLISPCIMVAKNLMKDIWKSGCEWDQEVPLAMKNQFVSFLKQLPRLSELRIPRWITTKDDHSKIDLVGFSDASTLGYGACVYIRHTTENKLILLSGKTKVAPSNFVSVARLELCGAVLLTELLRWASDLFRQEVNIEAYCDSKIVLSWLNSHPSKWKVFVANRTTQILDFLPVESWHYIDTKNNPADYTSRGLYPDELILNSLWWNGPSTSLLTGGLENHPLTPPTDVQLKEIETEQRNIPSNCFSCITKKNELLERYSSHKKLVSIVKMCCMFFSKCINTMPTPKSESIVSIMNHIENPEVVIIRSLQLLFFKSEIDDLKNNKGVDKRSNILSLNPFLDSNDILRVGGRIENSIALSFDEKHPIIIPTKHQVTTNLISDAHQKTVHGTIKETQAYLRRKYHIIRASDRVKLFIHKCIPCFRFLSKRREELMGILPHPRVNVTRPFTHTGVDFAGPVKVKVWKGRIKSFYKSYICIFVCLATKAVHIELVTDLSSDGFLASFKRFTSRRGRVHSMYSDQGTNFVGAARILNEEIQAAISTWNEELKSTLVDLGTDWHLNPPASPNFGGLWEAGVKSVKTHMYKILKDVFFTFEELNTLLVQIEGSLNSRPLCPLSSNPEDYSFLTPSHFLIGEAIVAPPEPSLEFRRISPLRRWQLIQSLFQSFWKLWSRDYLHHLQRRSKWRSKSPRQIQTNDLVILCEDNYPPMMWPQARVLSIHPGKDNIVRVVSLKKSDGSILKRPISKIRLLPLDDYAEA